MNLIINFKFHFRTPTDGINGNNMLSMPIVKVETVPVEENNNPDVIEVKMFDWNSFARENMGYEAQTTFWSDFSIADRFGAAAVRDTFERAMKEWKCNHIYLTELVIVLNHKIWFWHSKHNDTFAKLYDELWREADSYACENLKGEELSYYFDTLD